MSRYSQKTLETCVDSDLQVVPLEQVPVVGAVQQQVSTGLFPGLLSVPERPVPVGPSGGRPVTAAVPHPVTSETRARGDRQEPTETRLGWTGTFWRGHTHLRSGPWFPVPGFRSLASGCERLHRKLAAPEVPRRARAPASVGRVSAGRLDPSPPSSVRGQNTPLPASSRLFPPAESRFRPSSRPQVGSARFGSVRREHVRTVRAVRTVRTVGAVGAVGSTGGLSSRFYFEGIKRKTSKESEHIR